MNYNYDDERPGMFTPGGNTPEGGTPYAAGENTDSAAAIPELPEIPETPADSMYTPYTPYAAYIPPQREDASAPQPLTEDTPVSPPPAAVPEPPSRPQREPWRDPSYSVVPESTPSVYSPGLAQPSYPQKRRQEPREERVEAFGGGRRSGGFVRAACLVLVCAIASAAAAFGVLEYKDVGSEQQAPPSQQTQSGDLSSPGPETTGGKQPDSGVVVTRPVVNTGDALTAQEIYEMACREVVVIRSSVTVMNGFTRQPSTSVVSGSGFIIREDGYIVTNYHVVESAYTGSGNLTVTLNNGDEYPATIIGVEPSNDTAVIKIDATELDAVTIGDSGSMRVGETVYAVGNPLGELVYTITDGIVSALDREITVDTVTMNMFQISAAVNSGNSGGPVYDTYGNVVGVVTAKFNSSSVEGIGFAIPINDAMRIAGNLMEHGYIVDSKAYLGITARTVDSTTAEYYDWVVGAYVLSVEPGSCADKAGLQIGDIITKVGSISVTSQETLIYAKKCFNAGDTTELTVRRSGEDVTLTITFDTEPETTETAATEPNQEPEPGVKRIELEPFETPQARDAERQLIPTP